MTLKIVTANRLREGDVVYLADDGDWSDWITDGGVAESPEEEARLLATAERAVEARLVIAPYLMEVARANGETGELRPLGQREIIRATGPSVRPDLGKQAVKET